MKLYNHALAPNPRRVRIFAAEKGIELPLEEVDILAGQSRTSEFLAKNSSGAVREGRGGGGARPTRASGDREVESPDGT